MLWSLSSDVATLYSDHITIELSGPHHGDIRRTGLWCGV
jgi:hypothetical protein